MDREGIRVLLVLTLLGVTPPTAIAMRWQTAGPEAGKVHALVVEPATGNVYAGTEGGGVFKSVDEGATWKAVNTGLGNTIVSGLAVDPTRPGTVYAATEGSGVFRTVDGGVSWTQLPVPSLGGWIRGVVVDPRTPTTIYALGYSLLFKSIDAGESWQSMNMCVWNTSVRSLAFDPFDPHVLYAGTETAGVCKSVDGGQTWVSTTQSTYYSGMHTIAVHPTTPNLVLAAAWWGGIYRTLDAGHTWTEVDRLASGGQVYAFAFDPLDPSTVYAGTTGLVSVLVSHDSGTTWSGLAEGTGVYDVSAFSISPTGTTLYAGTFYDGVMRSRDRGVTWERRVHGFAATMVDTLAVHPANPRLVYAGLDTGEVILSDDGGASWAPTGIAREWFATTALAVDPGAPDRVYAGAVTGLSVSNDRGATWQQVLWDQVDSIVVDASSTPSVVYVLTPSGVYRSAGAGWSGLAAPPYSNYLTTLAVDHHDAGVLYASSDVGYLYRSDDAGASWNFVTVVEDFSVHRLFVDATLPSTVFAVSSDGVHVSTDGGETWASANEGFPEDHDLTAFALDPGEPPVFYAGLDDGRILTSEDRAETWTPIGEGIPATPVIALALSSGTHALYAGTAGSGAYALLPYCGDETVDDGEECDAGGAPCCVACRIAPDACMPCDTCDPTGQCVAAPRSDCNQAKTSSLSLLDRGDVGRDAFRWKLRASQSSSPSPFGNPMQGTSYAVCLYGPDDGVLWRSALPSALLCADPGCWNEKKASFQYRSKSGLPVGITRAELAVKPGRASFAIRGSGPLLDLALPAPWSLPVRAQLQVQDGQCWDATFAAPTQNASGRFKAQLK